MNPPLTERRQRQTRMDIADAAVALFIEHGFDTVPMDQVAEAAGVSRRTVYRYFPTKEDLVFDHPQRWLEVFDAVLADREPAESTRSVCRRGLLAVAHFIDDSTQEAMNAYTVYAMTESLRGSAARTQLVWVERYATLISTDIGAQAPAHLDAMIMANALMSTTTALCQVWFARYPKATMADLTAAALDRIDPLWPQESR